MSNGSQRRTRSERVAALELPPGRWERAWIGVCHHDFLARAGLSLGAAAAICFFIRAWDPPMRGREGSTPNHFVTSRVDFSRSDPDATSEARNKARQETKAVFKHDPQAIVRLRNTLRTAVADVTKSETLNEASQQLWKEFQPPQAEPPPIKPVPQLSGTAANTFKGDPSFQEFRKELAGKENLDRLDEAVKLALERFENDGLLSEPTLKLEGQNVQVIDVYPVARPEERREFNVGHVIYDRDKAAAIRQTLRDELGSSAVATRIFNWLELHLLNPKPLYTLSYDREKTKEAKDQNAKNVDEVIHTFKAGETLVAAGEKIDAKKMDLINAEYRKYLKERSSSQRVGRGLAVLLVVFAMFMLCGMYMRFRQRGPQGEVDRFAGTLGLAVGTVALALWASNDMWRAESVPLIVFGMTMALAYKQELALLISGVVAWIIVLAMGYAMPNFMLLFGTTAAAALNMGRIRSRTKLFYVGLLAGGVATMLAVAVNLIDDQAIGTALFRTAAWQGVLAVAAGIIMTAMLPFVEKLFGVLTDLSLLELGDITHPLLQELVRRAPSTYNHSITVGSIAEAAAESIGGRGLLCRVGAYFHDIGKMLKPGYFVENQGKDGSRHDGLVPAMSTLVIIAHIKDGADLARQHRLPQPLIDMIQQHHGTMLMEYFYDRAQKDEHNGGSEVDEHLFRYPGPKPQTKEAAVLMLADAVESASRTLIDPTPARIESLVAELAQRRLEGGQFDESGLTLRELGTIQHSLVMSVASIYHGRLKYPDQKTA
jgi:putative nucleotidyltransferase with HDIG domain